MATGYFNLPQSYIQAIANSKIKFDFLTASPKANGFYKGGFFKKWIPYFYRVYELHFLKKMKKSAKTDWTFHAKGLWIYENNESLPSSTIIGSSNYCTE